MFKQIRREDKLQQETSTGLEVDMNLLLKTPKPVKKSKDVIPEDMQDNVYAAILEDIPTTPSRIKISSPKQVIQKTPLSVTKTPIAAAKSTQLSPIIISKTPIQIPKTPIQITKTPIQVPKTPSQLPKTPKTRINEDVSQKSELKKTPKRETESSKYNAVEIKTPKKPTSSKTKTKDIGIYKNFLPPTEFDLGLETIEFNDPPKTKKSKVDKDNPEEAGDKLKVNAKSKSKSKIKSEPVVDEAYIKQHTTDMEYIEIADPDQVRLEDHIKYLNKDGKLMHAFVRDKYKDKETDTYKFKVTIQPNGGFGWTVNYGNIQKMWRRPVITTSTEQTIELLVRYLDMKFDGEFTEFARDADRFIEIFNRLKGKKTK